MDTVQAGKLITRIEDDPEKVDSVLAGLEAKEALKIGLTGPPGCGKSTLIARLIEGYLERKKKVAVLAIDPSSPLTGGALLGDRIRMQMHSVEENVFIRSMATRGHLGGLSPATEGAAKVLAAWGADIVIIETVGVGQNETEIMKVADRVVVVLTPLMGDEIQMLKAGVFEIADVFVINKSDQKKADGLARELKVHFDRPVFLTAANEGTGIEELIGELEKTP